MALFDAATRLAERIPLDHLGITAHANAVVAAQAVVAARASAADINRALDTVSAAEAPEVRIAKTMCLVVRNSIPEFGPNPEKLARRISSSIVNHGGECTWPRK